MGYQLAIESFLNETIVSKRIRAKVRRIARTVRECISNQLDIIFPRPSDRIERFKQLNRATGTWEWKERTISFETKKTGKVGSPVKMRKMIKDTPYLTSILD